MRGGFLLGAASLGASGGSAGPLPFLSEASSSDTLAFTSTAPSSVAASRVGSRAPSARESLNGPAEAAPATGPGKVAQIRSFFEQRLSAASAVSNASNATTTTDAKAMFSSADAKASQGLDPSRSSAWRRCASDMVRRLRQEELRTSRVTEKLMRRLEELGGLESVDLSGLEGCAFDGLPGTAAAQSPARSSDASEDEHDANANQLHRRMFAYQASHFRTHSQISQAMLRVLYLEEARGGARSAQGRCRSDGVALGWAMTAPCEAEDTEACSFSASPASFGGGFTGSCGSLGEEATVRASILQPEEEADELQPPEEEPSAGGGLLREEAPLAEGKHGTPKQAASEERGYRHSGGDDPEPAIEPQSKESPRVEERLLASPPPCQKQRPEGDVAVSPVRESPSRRGLLHVPTPSRRSSQRSLSRARLQASEEEVAAPGGTLEDEEVSLAESASPASTGLEEQLEEEADEEEGQEQLEDSATFSDESGGDMVEHRDALEQQAPDEDLRIWQAMSPDQQRNYILHHNPESYPRWYQESYKPKPGEEGMPRACTVLHSIEQAALHREMNLYVPEGMGSDRQVMFHFNDKEYHTTVPVGYHVGDQFTVVVPTKRPPLERNRQQALLRDHAQFPDISSLWQWVRHPMQVSLETVTFETEEVKTRISQYKLLGGKDMSPLLPCTPEDEEA